jgi:uncharacterized repeat protein (TIGR02543 family)
LQLANYYPFRQRKGYARFAQTKGIFMRRFKFHIALVVSVLLIVTGLPITALADSGAEPFTVTYNVNGGDSLPKSTFTIDDTYKQELTNNGLPVPQRTGHSFAGWFDAASGGKSFTKDDVINATANLALHAQWIKNFYPVNLYANKGSVNGGSSYTVSIRYGDIYKESAFPKPVRKGYAFTGWYTKASGGSNFKSATMSTKSPSYYAHWKANTYTLTLNAKGGGFSTLTSPKTKKLKRKFGSAYKTLATPKRERMTFLGWYTKAKSGKKVKAATIYNKAGNQTLYAHWKKATHVKVNFNPLGGSVSKASKSYPYNSNIRSMPAPTRSGYDFAGWYTSKTGGSLWTYGSKVTTKYAQTTLYARWIPHQFFQFDSRWGYKSYSVSNIANAGCGPSAMSMIVYTLADRSITPATACAFSTQNGYTKPGPGRTKDAFFTAYAKAHNVKLKKLNDGDLRTKSKKSRDEINDAAKAEIAKGNWILCYMGPGTWTHVGHFILWYDTKNGHALVRDPNATKEAKTRNTVSHLQSQVVRYWVVKVPDAKKLVPK